MPNTNTPRYGLIEPEVSADNNLWGTHLNADLVSVDSLHAVPRYPRRIVSAGAITLAQGIIHEMTVSGPVTVSISNTPPDITTPVTENYGVIFFLKVINGGSAAVTWPGSVVWTDGQPALETAGVDWLCFITNDAGVTWYGHKLMSSVAAGDIDANAVRTAKIQDAAVTQPKIDPAFADNISARVTRASSQAISGETAVQWTSEAGGELFDNGGMHDNAVNPERLTAPASRGGVYVVVAQVHCDGAEGGPTRDLRIYKNASTLVGYNRHQGGSNIIQATAIVTLAAGDYVKCTIQSTVAENVTGAEANSYFACYRLHV